MKDNITFPLVPNEDPNITCIVCGGANWPATGKMHVDYEFGVGTTGGSAWHGIHKECIPRGEVQMRLATRSFLAQIIDELNEAYRDAKDTKTADYLSGMRRAMLPIIEAYSQNRKESDRLGTFDE